MEPPRPPLALRLALVALGFSAVITQLVLMRELLSALAGNEIGIGLLLGNWLLLMGVGAFAGRFALRAKDPLRWLIVALVLLAWLPEIAVLLLRGLWNVVFIRGVEAGVVESAVSCLVLLAPYCLLSGGVLTLACAAPLIRAAGRDGNASALGVGEVYLLDSLGSIAGGVCFTFILVDRLLPCAALAVPAGMIFLAAAALALQGRRAGLSAAVALTGGALALLLAGVDLENLSLARQYPEARIALHGQSPYGRLVVTENSGQYDFYENGVPAFSTHSIESAEETVHFAMAQSPRARRVLLLSGGVSGTTREILKYPIEALDYVELDPLIIQAGRRFMPESLTDARLKVICADPRFFVRQTQARYDVAIIDLPPPSTSQLNRFYTREFYSALKQVLTPEGVISFAVGQYDDYLSPALTQLIAGAHVTVRQVFAHVLVLPAGRVFFLASERPLENDIATQLERAVVPTQWMKRAYLDSVLTPDRLADMRRAAAASAPINADFNPTLYYRHLRHWLTKFQSGGTVLLGVAALLLLVYLCRLRALPLAIFTAGFAAAALELVLLLSFQILLGALYYQLGLIVTAFMIGLLAGACIGKWRLAGGGPARPAMRLSFLIALVAAAMPLWLLPLAQVDVASHSVAVQIILSAAALIIAALTGLQFTAAGQGQDGALASRLYTADFIGASLGALLAGTVLIPLLGVVNVCLLVGGLNALSGAALWKSRS